MADCAGPRGTDRAFERLARLGADPAATLDDPPGVTAELPELPESPPPGRHRHRAPARLRDRAAYGVTGVALAGAVILAAVMAAGGGDDGAPGVAPPPTVSEPEGAPSSIRPPRAVPPPAPSRTRTPSTSPTRSPSPTPAARTVTVTPSPSLAHSPAPPDPSPAPSATETTTNPAPPPPPPCAEGQEPPACTPTEEAG